MLRFTPSRELIQKLKEQGDVFLNLDKKISGYSAEYHDSELKTVFDSFEKKEMSHGKSIFHLVRLARKDRNQEQKVKGYPSDVQKRFAAAFMKHASAAAPKDVLKALDMEGTGVNQFWTFAPYIHHQLTKKIGERKSIKTLLAWARESMANNKQFPLFDNLYGLHFIRRALRLEEDSAKTKKTHEFAAKLSEEIARPLIEAYA